MSISNYVHLVHWGQFSVLSTRYALSEDNIGKETNKKNLLQIWKIRLLWKKETTVGEWWLFIERTFIQ